MTEPVGEKGIMDGQLDWGGQGGKCWECWVVDPCCSGYCCITWWCLGSCNSCKMFSWALGQDCACIHHCIPLYIGAGAFGCYRFAVRKKLGISAGGPMEGWVGDCLLSYCCGACSGCQMLRGAHIKDGQESWDFIAGKKTLAADKFISFPPFTPME